MRTRRTEEGAEKYSFLLFLLEECFAAIAMLVLSQHCVRRIRHKDTRTRRTWVCLDHDGRRLARDSDAAIAGEME